MPSSPNRVVGLGLESKFYVVLKEINVRLSSVRLNRRTLLIICFHVKFDVGRDRIPELKWLPMIAPVRKRVMRPRVGALRRVVSLSVPLEIRRMVGPFGFNYFSVSITR